MTRLFVLNLELAACALRDRQNALTLWRSRYFLDEAEGYVRRALGIANRMRDRKRAGLCLRILNWIRVDLARTV